MDAAMIENESMDTRIKSKTPKILCKLDIEKTYDHVNRDFLINVLKDMGFSRKWLKWLFFCITMVTFSILINHSLVGFPSQMGLRLDDHLSPFLLVLVMEGFSRMLRIASHSGWIRGFKVANIGFNIMENPNFLYADDTLVVFYASVEQGI